MVQQIKSPQTILLHEIISGMTEPFERQKIRLIYHQRTGEYPYDASVYNVIKRIKKERQKEMTPSPEKEKINKAEIVREAMTKCTSRKNWNVKIAAQRILHNKGRNDVEITTDDVRNVLTGKNGTVTPQTIKLPISKPPQDAYTITELRTAKDYLAKCGNSLHKAKTLLDAIASLTIS